MALVEVLAWATLLVAVPLNAYAAFLLFKQWRARPHLRVLKERFVTQVGVALLVLFFGLIFVQNDQIPPPISLDATKVITRLAMLSLAVVVGGGWLLVYHRLSKQQARPD